MPNTIVSVKDISKQYHINRPAPAGGAAGSATASGTEKNSFNALHNISFNVQRGDVLGIMGSNGSGKSTLLKILSETVKPTTGRIEIQGTVASILEVGAGFHPDLTGKENVFFYGTLLGIDKKKLAARLPEIIEFSGIADFIDTPVKHYSSGMYLRLAVAIIFHVDAEILLLDEILSVGDAEFRIKTLRKMADAAQKGTTIIMVSHNPNEILQLCNKCMILDHGNIVAFGNPAESIGNYLDKAAENATKQGALNKQGAQLNEGAVWNWRSPDVAPGNAEFRIKRVAVYAKGKDVAAKIFMEDELMVDVEFWKLKKDMTVEVMMTFFDRIGTPVLATSGVWNKNREKIYGLYRNEDGLFKISATLPNLLLHKGKYAMQLKFGKDTTFDTTYELYTHSEQFHFIIHQNPERPTETFLDNVPIAVRPHGYWTHTKVADK